MWVLVFVGCGAPKLAVGAPDGVVTKPFALDVQTDASWMELVVDGVATPVEGTEVMVNPEGWTDGEHTVGVRAGSFLSSVATAEVVVTSDTHGPVLSLAGRSRAVEQGHTLAVFFESNEPLASQTVRFLDRERSPFAVGDSRWRALIGVPIRTEAKAHPLVIEATDIHGNTTTAEVSVEVSAVDWVTSGKLPLSKKAATVEPEGRKRMRAERDAVYATASDTAAWTGAFALPLDGTHTSAFGTFREYPDGKRSHHDAEDIAHKQGRPIVAAADGRVAIAHMQEVHGNAILLDHGHKVVSLYSHLEGFKVREGQHVKRGDLIGHVGSTGRSTGPHLHWGVVVDEVPVDPMQWLEDGFGIDTAAFTPIPTD